MAASHGPTLLIILTLLLLSLYMHFELSGSSIRIDRDVWNNSLDYHLNHRPFNMRPLQSYATVGLHALTGLPYREAFYIIQYLLAAVTGLLFYRYLAALGFDRVWSHVGLALFLLCFPVLAAHFQPIHTWDDFWMYSFLLAMSLAILKHRWILATAFFTAGCFAREATLFFYPVVGYIAWLDRRQVRPLILAASLVIPLVVYGLYVQSFKDPYAPGTWRMIAHNFGDAPHAADSLVSLINSFGYLWPAALIGLLFLLRRSRSRAEDFCFWGGMIVWPLTTVMASAFAMVRETRLLFPPFLFVLPLALWTIRRLWRSVVDFAGFRGIVAVGLVGMTMAAVGVTLTPVIWPAFDYQASSLLRRDAAGAYLGSGMAFLLVWIVAHLAQRRRPSNNRLDL
jgi:hypothetical protein